MLLEAGAEKAVIRTGEQYQAILPQTLPRQSIGDYQMDEKQRVGTDASLCKRVEASVSGWQGSNMETRFIEAIEAHGKDFVKVRNTMNRLALCAPAFGAAVLGGRVHQMVTIGHVAAFYYGWWRSSPRREGWKRQQRRRRVPTKDRPAKVSFA